MLILRLEKKIKQLEQLRMQDNKKELKTILGQYFKMEKRRLNFLCLLVLAVIKMRTIKYSHLAKVVNPKVLEASNFKRIQRFMRFALIKEANFVQFIFHLFERKNSQIILAIDRTNWEFGKAKINFLVIGIAYKNSCIPLIWCLLDNNGGGSSSENRIALFDKLWSYLTEAQIAKTCCLVGDKEFIGKDFLAYLKNKNIDFVIRVKENTLIREKGSGKQLRAERIFNSSKLITLRSVRVVWGMELYVSGYRNSDGKYIILVSSMAKRKFSFYKRRWGIEVMFSSYKKRGFNFEDSHVVKIERLNNLMFILSIAVAFSQKVGATLLKKGLKIPQKRFRTPKPRIAPLYSFFRLGLGHIQRKLLHAPHLSLDFQILSCT